MTDGSREPGFLRLPLRDVLGGLERCMAGGGASLPALLAGLAAGWWLYVPSHELLHALACLAAGGEVSRLEIAPLYGGEALARIFPFVVAGGEYAGRLSGFDTGGNDLIYLATDLGPYLLTLWPGVWLLRRGARLAAARGWRWSALFGFALPLALAPFLSLTGDAYEIASILTTRLPPWSAPALSETLRGDDLFLVVPRLRGVAAWTGAALATLLGTAWAFGTYWLGHAVARRLGERSAG